MKKILLVGGAGYVGSVLARELLDRGYAVKILDRMYFGDQGVSGIRDRVEVIVADMRNIPDGTLDDVSAVVNIDGLSNDPTAEFNPAANYEMNTTASISLAEACVRAGVSRYVYASSCSIYDYGTIDQEKDLLLDETAHVDPKAAYSGSKYAAEKGLLPMASKTFCVTALRKGTIYGYSPRMRFDLVVNTFVKDALTKGYLTLNGGGEMWRPMVDIRDVARAYIAILQADTELVNCQIFNLVYKNYRISELALRVRNALNMVRKIETGIKPDYSNKNVRNYRVSGEKLYQILGFRPTVCVEESVADMNQEIRERRITDFENPRYYNINWMSQLEEAHKIISVTGSVFGG